MALNIKNPETVAAIRQLAALTGRSLTDTVEVAIKEAIERTARSRPIEDRLAPLRDKVNAARGRRS